MPGHCTSFSMHVTADIASQHEMLAGLKHHGGHGGSVLNKRGALGASTLARLCVDMQLQDLIQVGRVLQQHQQACSCVR